MGPFMRRASYVCLELSDKTEEKKCILEPLTNDYKF